LSLLIDIGTNGEIVIGNNEWLLSCSASAGPAFEGGDTKWGMRATRGAIEKVQMDAKDFDERAHYLLDELNVAKERLRQAYDTGDADKITGCAGSADRC
jgi:uncharacterized 2Fe-2S/4Fe-4S cluster protein (DUF4445 family)